MKQELVTFVISSDHVWAPGIYADERAANYAFRFMWETLEMLNKRICHVDGEFRPITFEDLKGAESEVASTYPLSQRNDGNSVRQE